MLPLHPASVTGRRRPVRVLLCDDHEIVREGLRTLLARGGSLEVVGVAATAAEAEDAAVRVTPDVVVTDVRLAGGSGIEVCRVIREILPETKVVMLTHFPDDEAVFASIVAGASAILLKETPVRALVAAILDVAAGESVLDFALAARAVERVHRVRPEVTH